MVSTWGWTGPSLMPLLATLAQGSQGAVGFWREQHSVSHTGWSGLPRASAGAQQGELVHKLFLCCLNLYQNKK